MSTVWDPGYEPAIRASWGGIIDTNKAIVAMKAEAEMRGRMLTGEEMRMVCELMLKRKLDEALENDRASAPARPSDPEDAR
jgi:hypothetical protein